MSRPGPATGLEASGRRARWRASRRSIRWQLVALFLLLALAIGLTFVVGLQQALRGGWQAWGRPLVGHYLDLLAADLGTPPDPARAQALVARLPLAIRIEGPTVQYDSHPQRRRWWTRPELDDDRTRDWFQRRTLADGHVVVFGLADPPPALRSRAVGGVTLLVLLGCTALAYGRVRQLLRPLDDLQAGAERYGRGDFVTPIVPRRPDELGDLAARVNAMASSLQQRLQAQRALLLAISHELRSPLTRARLHAELLEPGEAREALLRDLGLMRDLVTDLLESERLAGGHGGLVREPLHADTLVGEVVAALPAAGDVVLKLDADRDGPIEADRARLALLVRNLVDNALRHRRPGDAPPEVTLRRDGEHVVLQVRDHGPGVPDEHLPHLTEAFYRVDPARRRATGGVGLGLHLCRRVVEAHGGTLELRLAQPGLEVTARWPAHPPG